MHIMQSHYELNIALNGKHHARVYMDERKAVAQRKAADFAKRFPEEEGFKLTLTYWQGRGEQVEITDKPEPWNTVSYKTKKDMEKLEAYNGDNHETEKDAMNSAQFWQSRGYWVRVFKDNVMQHELQPGKKK